jgi:uncharacterized protein
MTTEARDRIELLDILRGFALIGILAINIRAFSEPMAAYANPLVYGDHIGLNWYWRSFQTVFIEFKFMSIFSMLFGVSTALICERAVAKGLHDGEIFRRRLLWLALIGLFHAYFIWYGDILVAYACAGFIPYICLKNKWQTNLAAGLAMLIISGLLYFGLIALGTDGDSAEMAAEWAPPAAIVASEVATYQGSWLDQFFYRLPFLLLNQTVGFLFFGMWQIGGAMLIGLALYQQGFFKGNWTLKGYLYAAALLVPIGLFIAFCGLFANEEANWAMEYSLGTGFLWNQLGGIILALGYCSVLAVAVKKGWFTRTFSALGHIGKMALTNYLFQSIACTTIFYGYGFGLFGKLQRYETAYIVLAVLILQTLLSNWWLQKHKKGPLEKLWNHFTYKTTLPLTPEELATAETKI